MTCSIYCISTRFAPGFDLRLLADGITLARCRHETGIDDLASHRQIAARFELAIELSESLAHPLARRFGSNKDRVGQRDSDHVFQANPDKVEAFAFRAQQRTCTINRGRLGRADIPSLVRSAILSDTGPVPEVRPACPEKHDRKIGGLFHNGVINRDGFNHLPRIRPETRKAEVGLHGNHRGTNRLH